MSEAARRIVVGLSVRAPSLAVTGVTMSKTTSREHDYAADAHGSNGARATHLDADPIDEAPDDSGEIVTTAATIAVVAVGAAIFEAALLPGLALGVVAALAPRVLPNVGSGLAPMFRSTVRGAYRLGQRTREMVVEAQEHVNAIVAEANAEDRAKATANKPATAA